MGIGESILYALTKRLYLRNMGQSEEMTQALSSVDSYAGYRQECLGKILSAANQYGVELKNRDVLDLGCFDGAISQGYLNAGAASVIGIDIDEPAVRSAQKKFAGDRLDFRVSGTDSFPVDDNCIDTIVCYDVFEHVQFPEPILNECFRVLRPGGKLLIGTWGWYHPFAPHLWSTMPVPWAHVLFSERTLLRTCRRVYQSDWYRPNMHDFDNQGQRIPDKFTNESIPVSYLNKFLIRDFEQAFRKSPLKYRIHSQRFSSKWAAWTKPLLKVPFLKEFFTAYIWVVLEKPAERPNARTPRRELAAV